MSHYYTQAELIEAWATLGLDDKGVCVCQKALSPVLSGFLAPQNVAAAFELGLQILFHRAVKDAPRRLPYKLPGERLVDSP